MSSSQQPTTTASDASRAGNDSILRAFLGVLRRRRWLVFIPIVVAVAISIAADQLRHPLFQAQAGVLLNRQSVAAAATGTQDPNQYGDFQRVVDTQAQIAESPEVARRVIAQLRLRDSVSKLQSRVTVSPDQTSDLLTIQAQAGSKQAAVRLANVYALAFTQYRLSLDSASLQKARNQLQQRLDQLQAAGKQSTELYRDEQSSEQRLSTLQALQSSNTTLAKEADTASTLRPQPVKAAVLGILAGLIVGLALALLRDTLDVRVRDAEEIATLLDRPLLGVLVAPDSDVRQTHRIDMIEAPSGPQAEAFRMLRTNIEFAAMGREMKVLMVTSGLAAEGKSTSAANLAIAFARSGRRVALVELDLRRPMLARLLDLGGAIGIGNVALGSATLADALTPVSIRPADGGGAPLAADTGSLSALVAGAVPADPGEFVHSAFMARTFAQLREEFDLVIVDTPPMLQVGDALAAAPLMDGSLILVKRQTARRPMLRSLARASQTMAAPILGVAATGARAGRGAYGYGYGYANYEPAPQDAVLTADRD